MGLILKCQIKPPCLYQAQEIKDPTCSEGGSMYANPKIVKRKLNQLNTSFNGASKPVTIEILHNIQHINLLGLHCLLCFKQNKLCGLLGCVLFLITYICNNIIFSQILWRTFSQFNVKVKSLLARQNPRLLVHLNATSH